MGKKVFHIFLTGFLKTLLVIACMLACAVGGFFATRYYYQQKNVSAVGKASEATRDDVAKNLIYVWDEDKKRICYCVLEVFDSKNQDLSYLTIPVAGQITLSGELFQKLYHISSEVPQMMRIAKLHDYFKTDDQAYGYGMTILENYFDIDISYYTVVSKEEFKKRFTTAKVKSGKGKVDGVVLKDDYLSSMSAYNDSDSLEKYLKDAYKQTKSNLDAKDRLSYAEAYAGVNREKIRYYALPTAMEGQNRVFDLELAEKIFNKCNVEGNTQAGQGGASDSGKSDSVSAPVLKNIIILNSTDTSGIAAKWSDTMKEHGYTVKEIGNYSPTLDKTRIVVKEDGQGEEFLDYFTDAELHTGKVPEGADAQIIIGVSDANN